MNNTTNWIEDKRRLLYEALYSKYGAVTRARGFFLYTKKGVRITDLYLEDGAAILGHKNSAYKNFKGILDRGLTSYLYTEYDNFVERAVNSLLGGKWQVYFFYNKFRAITTGLQLSMDKTLYYRPFRDKEDKVKECEVVALLSPCVLTPPVYILCIKKEFCLEKQIKEGAFGVRLSGAISMLIAKSIYNLIKEIKERDIKEAALYDGFIRRYWTRNGLYLTSRLKEADYDKFVLHCLDCHLLINPVYSEPSILPYGAAPSVFKVLYQNKFIKSTSPIKEKIEEGEGQEKENEGESKKKEEEEIEP